MAFMSVDLDDGDPEENKDLLWEVILRNFWALGLQHYVGPVFILFPLQAESLLLCRVVSLSHLQIRFKMGESCTDVFNTDNTSVAESDMQDELSRLNEQMPFRW